MTHRFIDIAVFPLAVSLASPNYVQLPATAAVPVVTVGKEAI